MKKSLFHDCSYHGNGDIPGPKEACECNAFPKFTIHRHAHGQDCPACGYRLNALKSQFAHGYHHWILECLKCETKFDYTSYENKLKKIN
jgi:hypothetical protein